MLQNIAIGVLTVIIIAAGIFVFRWENGPDEEDGTRVSDSSEDK